MEAQARVMIDADSHLRPLRIVDPSFIDVLFYLCRDREYIGAHVESTKRIAHVNAGIVGMDWFLSGRPCYDYPA